MNKAISAFQPSLIREAEPQDAAALLEFLNIVGVETDNLTFGSEGFPFTEEQEREYIIRMHEDPHSVALLAFDGSRIIGDAAISGLSRRMSHRGDFAISVLREYWGSGIGSALLERAIGYARANGIEILSLEVRCDNERAIHLYEKYGFRIIGTFPAFFKIERDDSVEYVDFYIMHLDLREEL